MALVDCKECGNPISTLAVSCPKCGAPTDVALQAATPSPSKPDVANKHGGLSGCLIIVISFGALMVVLIILGQCTGNGSDIAGNPHIKAAVEFTGSQFLITNKDRFDWHDCKIEVNSGYTVEHVGILAGQKVAIGAMTFANGDGERFNPYTRKPQSLSLSCGADKDGTDGFVYMTF